MEMTGEQLIPASQADTWAALNDPEFLKSCIPGCEVMERTGSDEYTMQMTARVGPVSAKFKGRMTLSNVKPPDSYSIAFEGQGGVAGFAKGGADVRLAPEGHATRLAYTVRANVGGKLAQIGSRLVDAAAAKVAGDFFSAFNERLAGPAHEEAHHEEHHPEPVPRDPDLPVVSDASASFFAAGALVVFVVALLTLI
ncbi:MAG: carbon monoxide dehydrogenase subunit G [Burkholderiales bacterium]